MGYDGISLFYFLESFGNPNSHPKGYPAAPVEHHPTNLTVAAMRPEMWFI